VAQNWAEKFVNACIRKFNGIQEEWPKIGPKKWPKFRPKNNGPKLGRNICECMN
jgi:hypothetical protein